MHTLNSILEVINGSWSILAGLFLVFLTFYLWEEFRRRRLTWRRALYSLPVGMSLAVVIYLEQTGTFITRSVIWYWRMSGGGAFSQTQMVMLIIGAVTAAAGMMFMIRVVSKARFGNWPWLVSAGIVFLYVAGALIVRRV